MLEPRCVLRPGESQTQPDRVFRILRALRSSSGNCAQNSTVSAGLGLGLFGVLSIIRLRSDQISQTEIAYYFASLALGLLTGMSSAVTPLLGGLIALILVALAFGDSKLILGRYTSQTVQLDRAIADPAELKAALEQRLGASVASVNVVKLDLVNDLTLVDVRSKVA